MSVGKIGMLLMQIVRNADFILNLAVDKSKNPDLLKFNSTLFIISQLYLVA